jgi:hypothetical protein
VNIFNIWEVGKIIQRISSLEKGQVLLMYMLKLQYIGPGFSHEKYTITVTVYSRLSISRSRRDLRKKSGLQNVEINIQATIKIKIEQLIFSVLLWFICLSRHFVISFFGFLDDFEIARVDCI